MVRVYRIGFDLFVQDFSDPGMKAEMIANGEDPETIYLERVTFRPMEWHNPDDEDDDYHPYKVEIAYTEEYYSLPDNFGVNDLSGFSYFDAGRT